MNDTNYNHLKMTKGGNFHSGNSENKNNNSMEIQIDTQYSKKNFKSMGKKVKKDKQWFFKKSFTLILI